MKKTIYIICVLGVLFAAQASAITCDSMKILMRETLNPVIFEVIELQDSFMAAFSVYPLSELKKLKGLNDTLLCSEYRKIMLDSKYIEQLPFRSLEYYGVHTAILNSQIPLHAIQCSCGKIFLSRVDVMNYHNEFKSDISFEIDGKFMHMKSPIFTLGEATGYIVRTLDMPLDNVVGTKYVFEIAAPQLQEFNSLDEIINSVLPEECR